MAGGNVCHGNWRVKSLAPDRLKRNLSSCNLILVNKGWGIPCEMALKWLSLDFTDDKLTLVQVMAWCRQATSHYLSQYWPKFMLPCGVTRPQWVNGGLLKLSIKFSTRDVLNFQNYLLYHLNHIHIWQESWQLNGFSSCQTWMPYSIHNYHFGNPAKPVEIIEPRILVKVQFRGPELFKKKGALIQVELYLPGIFMPSWTSWRYDCGWMASIWM